MSDPAPPLVIDASVAVALVRQERASVAVHRLVAGWRSRGGELIAPSFLWIEFANALVHRSPTPDVTVEAIHDVERLGVRTVPVDRPLLLLAIQHAHASRLTIYDALYLALAEVEDARLATADRMLAEAAGPRAILLGEGEGAVREASADYGSGAAGHGPADADAWPGLDTYIDRLRRTAAAARPGSRR